MKTKVADLIVLGGGPAGALSAIGALQADPAMKVVLVDKRGAGDEKIGEALLTGTIYTLEEAGVLGDLMKANYHRKEGAAYVWGECREPWYVDYEPKEDYPTSMSATGRRFAWHVPRWDFDERLRVLAQDKGAELVEDRVIEATTTGSGRDGQVVGAVGEKYKYVAGQWIDATGQAAVLSRNFGKRRRIGKARTSRYAYTRNIDWKRAEAAGFSMYKTNIVSSSAGWFWVIHLGDAGLGLTSVGFVSSPWILKRLDLSSLSNIFPGVSMFGDKILSDASSSRGEALKNWIKAPDYSYFSTVCEGVNWASAGDAFGFIDPILSQGVTLACHYGLLRGRATANLTGENGCRQRSISEHYFNELRVLKDVTSFWYQNNRSVDEWMLQSALISESLDMSHPEAFMHMTNLENLRNEFHPYSERQRETILKKLSGEAR